MKYTMCYNMKHINTENFELATDSYIWHQKQEQQKKK